MTRQRCQQDAVNSNSHNEAIDRVPDASTYPVCLESDVLGIFPVSDDPDKGVTSESKGEDEKRSVPDGGWGWVVCAASFVVNFIVDGTMFCFGVLLVELLDDFRESKAVTSWVGSAQLGMSMMMGPAVSGLLKRFSVRQVTIAGSLVCALGFIASVFAPNVYVLILLYGIVAGTGFCAVFLPAVLVVGLYFNNKRAIATGIATSGSGVGTFAYPYVCELLLWHYGWRHTVLILGAVLLNCLACGMVFRPLPAARHHGRKRTLRGKDDNVAAQQLERTGLLGSDAETCRRGESPMSLEFPCAMQPSTGRYWEDVNRKEKDPKAGFFTRCARGLSSVLGIDLFRNKTFLLLLLTFCMWTVQSVPLIFLPDMAIAKGVPREEAAFLISIVGLTNTVTRAVAGLVTDVLHVRCIWLYVVALLVAAVVCYVLPLCQDFPALAAAAAVFGACMAVAVSMRTIVIAEEIGVEMLTQSFGVVALFQGVFFMANPPMAGELFRQTDSYLLPFVMAGSMYLISALSSLVVAIWLKPTPVHSHTLTISVETRV